MSSIESSTQAKQPVPYLAIIFAFIVTEAVMIASAFAWVFIYSITIETGGDQAFYEAYAQDASPVVAVIMAFPMFYAMGYFMRRYGARARQAAIAVLAANLVLDAVVVSTMAVDLSYNLIMSVVAAALKTAGTWYGSRSAL